MKIVISIILALSIVVLLRALAYFIKIGTRDKSWHHYTLQLFPWIEVSVWALFVFWIVQYFLWETAVYPLVITSLSLLVIILLSWYVVRDFFAGVVLRSDHALETGIKIKTDFLSGTISHLGYISLEIIDEDGERKQINYHNIIDQNIVKVTDKGRGKSQMVKVMIPQYFGAQNIEQMLTRKLLEFPWVIAEGEIKINMQTSEDFYETEITFYSIKEEMFVKTEEIIRSYVKESFSVA